MTSPSPDSLLAGRYEVVRTLGKGAFGRTFLARDHHAERDVAIKMLDPQGPADLKVFQLFEREATVLRSLRHHGIPEVHDSLRAQWDGIDAAMLVMEYVEGRSLAQLIDEQHHFGPDEAFNLLVELLGILEYLHGRVPPILHRDIKPSNIIMRPDGTPVLVDFGAVRRVFRGPDDSGSTVVGTFGYMPYEQFMGLATPASDLYALGATFLHLVTGRAPPEFMAGQGRIEVPETLPGDPRLRAVITRLLRVAPDDRYPSAKEARQALFSSSSVALAISSGSRPLPATMADLGPAPRPLTGAPKALYKAIAPSGWRVMNASSKSSDRIGLVDVALTLFFSVLTAGVLPAVFFGVAYSWRRRLRQFITHGLPAYATIHSITLEDLAFGEKLARVNYEFEADGSVHRDTDQTLPVIAAKWRPEDRILILYRPDRNYDSVIISQ